jgi:hypothetical protein
VRVRERETDPPLQHPPPQKRAPRTTPPPPDPAPMHELVLPVRIHAPVAN